MRKILNTLKLIYLRHKRENNVIHSNAKQKSPDHNIAFETHGLKIVIERKLKVIPSLLIIVDSRGKNIKTANIKIENAYTAHTNQFCLKTEKLF